MKPSFLPTTWAMQLLMQRRDKSKLKGWPLPMMAMRVNMVEIEKLLVIVILKEESKQHGRSLVIITGYSQVNNLFLPKNMKKLYEM